MLSKAWAYKISHLAFPVSLVGQLGCFHGETQFDVFFRVFTVPQVCEAAAICQLFGAETFNFIEMQWFPTTFITDSCVVLFSAIVGTQLTFNTGL